MTTKPLGIYRQLSTCRISNKESEGSVKHNDDDYDDDNNNNNTTTDTEKLLHINATQKSLL
jgi:hypothetical protein